MKRRWPGDIARRELPLIAAELRADAARPPGQRKFLGICSPMWLQAAAAVLDAAAAGEKTTTIIDRRLRGVPAEIAVDEFVKASATALNRNHALEMAAAAVGHKGISVRQMEAHVRADEKAKGAEYVVVHKGRRPRRKR